MQTETSDHSLRFDRFRRASPEARFRSDVPQLSGRETCRQCRPRGRPTRGSYGRRHDLPSSRRGPPSRPFLHRVEAFFVLGCGPSRASPEQREARPARSWMAADRATSRPRNAARSAVRGPINAVVEHSCRREQTVSWTMLVGTTSGGGRCTIWRSVEPVHRVVPSFLTRAGRAWETTT